MDIPPITPAAPVHRRRGRRTRVVAAAAVTALLVGAAGCDFYAPSGWPTIHADARNSDTTSVVGAAAMAHRWSRSVGPLVPAYASIAPDGTIYVTSSADGPCHLFALEGTTGDERWCSGEVGPGALTSTPLIDLDGNIYVGDDAVMASFTPDGELRWTTPIVGAPLSSQLTADGRLIFVTHVGRTYVLDRASGASLMTPYELVPGLTYSPGDGGFETCFSGGPDCPVANTLAMDLTSGRFYLTLYRPGAPAAELVALQYAGGGAPSVTPLWSHATLPGGSASSPDISLDGTRVYVNDNEGSLWAVDSVSGAPVWETPIGYAAAGSPSTSDDGLIIPAGGGEGTLMAVADRGDHGEVVWERPDLPQLGVPAQSAGGIGYAVVASSRRRLDLVTFDTATGATLDSDVLPDVTGFTVGISIGPAGEVVTPSILGRITSFAPAGG